MKKKDIACLLIGIIIISIILKIYHVDFSTPVTSDAMSYSLNAFSFVNGDFTPIFNKTSGWPLVIHTFFHLVDSDDFVVYSNIVRILSITASTATVIPIYFLARKWFPAKYSLVACSFFAFEPHLNRLAGIGYSESFYILIIVISFYFITSSRYRNICLAFLFAAIAWWIRWPGAIMFLVLSIIFFVNFQKSKKDFLKYLACVGIFLVLISPMLIERYNEFGDPLYFGTTSGVYSGDYAAVQGNVVNKLDEYTITDYIEENGFYEFFIQFVVTGVVNIITVLAKNSLPYLILLIPIGAILSFRSFGIDKKLIRANWILIIVTLVPIITTYAVIPDIRFLYPIIPFLILFATIPVHRFIENGIGDFNFSTQQKNIIIIMIILVVLVLSFVYMERYDTISKIEYEEKNEFAKYSLDNFKGRMLDAGGTTQGIRFLKLNEPNEVFKTYQNSNHKYPKDTILEQGYLVPVKSSDELILISIYAKSYDEFIALSKEYNLNYISIGEKKMAEIIYPYLKDLYNNESAYSDLEKVFDSTDRGYEEFKVKVFKINFKDDDG